MIGGLDGTLLILKGMVSSLQHSSLKAYVMQI